MTASTTPASRAAAQAAAGILLLLVLAFVLRIAWPASDPAARLSWSNEVYTDPAVMVHAARNKALFGEWILDYNHDYYVFPLMNWLTWGAYEAFGTGRFATLVLAALAGTATVAAVAWGLLRSCGPRAAWIGAGLGAVCYWTTMYSRVPVAENVVAALLAAAFVLATYRSPRVQALAGAVAVFATFFGKYHAGGALPGLFLFVVLRERSLRAALPLVAGGAAVFAVWLAAIFLPHRDLIVTHVQRQSTGFHGPFPFAVSIGDGFGEIYNSLRRSWMFYRMPVEGVLGSLFAFWTLGNGRARRRGLDDGTAVWAFWFVSMWIYYSLLPYKGPRYFILAAPPLLAGAAVLVDRLLSAAAFRLRPPARLDEHVPLLLWIYSFFFGGIDAVKHYASIYLEWAAVPPVHISAANYDRVVEFFGHFDTFHQNLAWAAAFTAAAGIFVLWHPELLRRLPGSPRELPARALRAFGAAAVVVAGVAGVGQYAAWAAHRTTFIEEIKRSVPRLVGPDAVVIGPLAPLLTQDTRLKVLPYFGPPGERGLLEKYGVTHAVVCGGGDAKELESRYANLMEQLSIVQAWPLLTLFSSSIELYRVPPAVDGVPIHDYHPTLFEEAAQAADEERWQEALALFGRIREHGGEPLPELISLEAVCSFKLDDLPRARTLLEEAIRLRPKDPLNYQNLGVIELREGKRAEAVRHWITALRLDPKNRDLEEKLRELVR